ncbi:hypothetical protein KIF24_19090 [Micromonospora sp. Llam7]|uniref:hypothetical protein n=1 Tax=Micromonospora tarapacensis TaxID=2835305 RepID=UPI001C83EEFB|nr:hypothetical protein [Micromonospora tarapacensis]MBX7267933.1 hypothetical protein [Micromonospora tarapacensis]
MARRRTPDRRPALVLAFAVGTLAGAAGTLTLRRRGRRRDGFPGETTGFDEDTNPAALDERFGNPAPAPVGVPATVDRG